MRSPNVNKESTLGIAVATHDFYTWNYKRRPHSFKQLIMLRVVFKHSNPVSETLAKRWLINLLRLSCLKKMRILCIGLNLLTAAICFYVNF